MIEEISHMTAIVVEENQENAPFFFHQNWPKKLVGWNLVINKKSRRWHSSTVKVDFNERSNKEQIGNSEQFCDGQKVPYYQVWL